MRREERSLGGCRGSSCGLTELQLTTEHRAVQHRHVLYSAAVLAQPQCARIASGGGGTTRRGSRTRRGRSLNAIKAQVGLPAQCFPAGLSCWSFKPEEAVRMERKSQTRLTCCLESTAVTLWGSHTCSLGPVQGRLTLFSCPHLCPLPGEQEF